MLINRKYLVKNVFVFLLVTLTLVPFQCKTKTLEGQGLGVVALELNDTIIVFQDSMRIAVPEEYTIYEGEGDDSKFLQIRNTNGSILISYEAGMESMKAFREITSIHSIQEEYNTLEKIRTNGNNTIWTAFNPTEGRLRNIRGKIFLGTDSHVKQVLNFECNTENLDEVKTIISTIKKIN